MLYPENFEQFWALYPKKVWKKPTFLKFKKITDFNNFETWFKLYLEKWKVEEMPLEFIPNPLTFLNQERYYDEIIIDRTKKEKYKKIIQARKEEKEEIKEIQKTEIQRQKLIDFYNLLNDFEKNKILKESESIIKNQNPKLYEKKWDLYEKYKKIIIRSILTKKINFSI